MTWIISIVWTTICRKNWCETVDTFSRVMVNVCFAKTWPRRLRDSMRVLSKFDLDWKPSIDPIEYWIFVMRPQIQYSNWVHPVSNTLLLYLQLLGDCNWMRVSYLLLACHSGVVLFLEGGSKTKQLECYCKLECRMWNLMNMPLCRLGHV